MEYKMSAFPSNADGNWSIYLLQKTLPYLGNIPLLSLLGARNYLVLVDPTGTPTLEVHGVYTSEFTSAGTITGNYLQVQYWEPNQYMSDQTIKSSKLVISGDKTTLKQALDMAYTNVKTTLDSKHILYDGGGGILGHAVNSNSVWSTLIRTLVGEDSPLYDGPNSAPGNDINLFTEPTNNSDLGTPADSVWKANPDKNTTFGVPIPKNSSEQQGTIFNPTTNHSFAKSDSLSQ
jgi:hypothetical protein